MSAATRPAEPAEQRPVALPLSTPKLPADLFAFIEPFRANGSDVEAKIVSGGRTLSVLIPHKLRGGEAYTDGAELTDSAGTELPFAEHRDLYLAVDDAFAGVVDSFVAELLEACRYEDAERREDAWGECR